MVTVAEQLRRRTGMTAVAVVTCDQLVEGLGSVTGCTIFIRKGIGQVVHCRTAVFVFALVTGCAIECITCNPVDPFVTAGTEAIFETVGDVVGCGGAVTGFCAIVTEFAIINGDRSTGMTAGAINAVCGRDSVVHLRAAVFLRLFGVTTFTTATEGHVDMAGSTVIGLSLLAFMVHRRTTAQPLALVTGGTVERRLGNAGVTGITSAVIGRIGRVVHRRAAVFRLVGMTGGAVERVGIDTIDALVTGSTVALRIKPFDSPTSCNVRLCGVVDHRDRDVVYRAGVAGLTSSLSRLVDIVNTGDRVRTHAVTIETAEAIGVLG